MAEHGRFQQDEGATAVEYGLIVAGVAAVIILVVITLGGQSKDLYCGTSSQMSSVPSVTTTQSPDC